MNIFAKLLNEYMKTVRLSDKTLADQIQVSPMTVYYWRIGKTKKPASRKKLLQCADLLKLTFKQRAEFIKAAEGLLDNSKPQLVPVVGIPIVQPSQFFGRENLLRQIYRAWDKPVPESMSIVGPKRSGKTSLLNYLNQITRVSYLRPEQLKSWPTNWRSRHFQFALIDFQDANMSQPETLIKDVLQQLKLEIPQACNLASFSNLIKEKLTQPAVILMDNIEIGIAAPGLETAFWQNMSSLGSCGQLSFVVTCLNQPQQLEHSGDKALPFFELFGHSFLLEAFTENEARELLAHSPKPFSPEEVEGMLKESGCWPEPLQKLCDRRLQQLLLEQM